MPLKTADEYVKSIKSLKLKANVMGETTDNLPQNPLVEPSIRAVAATYDCAITLKPNRFFGLNPPSAARR